MRRAVRTALTVEIWEAINAAWLDLQPSTRTSSRAASRPASTW